MWNIGRSRRQFQSLVRTCEIRTGAAMASGCQQCKASMCRVGLAEFHTFLRAQFQTGARCGVSATWREGVQGRCARLACPKRGSGIGNEDPFDVSRHLNDVLSKSTNNKLWIAFQKATRLQEPWSVWLNEDGSMGSDQRGIIKKDVLVNLLRKPCIAGGSGRVMAASDSSRPKRLCGKGGRWCSCGRQERKT